MAISKPRSVVLSLLVLFWAALTFAQITPSDDAYTNTATPATNLGTKPLLDVESASQTTYIRFDLSPLPSTFSGGNVAKATLKLYVNGVTTAGSFDVNLVTSSWSEKTITANDLPTMGSNVVSGVALTSANVHDYVLIDITPAVQGWLTEANSNDGIALVGNSPLNASFDSKENTGYSHPPELDIVFTGGGTLTGVTTAAGSGLFGGGTSGTLNLALTNSCATNQVLQWNGSSWACAAAGTGTVTNIGLSAPASDFVVSGSPISSSGTLNLNWNVAPTNADIANSIVKRDASGNFNAGIINAVQYTGSNVTVQAVYAQNAFSSGAALEGVSTSATDSSTGVIGVSTATSAKTSGVEGASSSPSGRGLLGIAPAASTMSTKLHTAAGVWGDTSNNGATSSQIVAGVVATADDGYAMIAANNSSSPTLSLYNFTTSSGSDLISGVAPSLPNQHPFAVTAGGSMGMGGKITSYNGLSTSGNGVPAIVASLTQTNKSGTQFTDVLAGASGLFRVSIYGVCVGPTGSSADGFAVQVLWTDSSGSAQNVYAHDPSGSDYVSCGSAASDFAQGSFVVQNEGGSGKDIIIVVGNTGNTTGTYDLFVTIEQLM